MLDLIVGHRLSVGLQFVRFLFLACGLLDYPSNQDTLAEQSHLHEADFTMSDFYQRDCYECLGLLRIAPKEIVHNVVNLLL
jgi:hypothetical protein